MKKTLLPMLLSILAALPAAGAAPRFSLTAAAGVRVFSDADLKRIYDGSHLGLALELGFRVRRLEAFIAGDGLSAEGKLTYTQEPTTLRWLALEAGGRYLFSAGPLAPYVGAGAGHYTVKEANVIGTLNKKKVGFFVLAGLRWRPAGRFFLSLQGKYVPLRISAGGREVDMGGFLASGGLGLSF